MTEEPRYTLEEAKKVIKDQECVYLGHSIMTVMRGFEVRHFVCTNCRKTWSPALIGRQTGPDPLDVDWGRGA